jgi:hypothetical protein
MLISKSHAHFQANLANFLAIRLARLVGDEVGPERSFLARDLADLDSIRSR